MATIVPINDFTFAEILFENSEERLLLEGLILQIQTILRELEVMILIYIEVNLE